MKTKTYDLVLISLFAALTAIGAFIKIDLPIVPITLQFFFAGLGAMLLGAKKGALAQIVYIMIGLVGFPVFAKGGGISYIFQPTFGYLIGFIFAAYVIGSIMERNQKINLFTALVATISGIVVIYVFGVSYMYMIFNFYLDQAMTLTQIIGFGVIPFVLSDLFSCTMVSLVSLKAIPILRKSVYRYSFSN